MNEVNPFPHVSSAGTPAGVPHPNAPAHIARGVGAGVAAWLIPGLGHLLLGRWGKALAYFLSIAALAYAGVVMHGLVFSASATDVLDRLGFVADLGAGLFYFAARASGVAVDLAHASGDYGTRLFATAGILNILTILEAYEIGIGRRD